MGSRVTSPRLEALEERALLSGNVAAVVSGVGNLTLTGDTLGNVITLTRDGDTVTITPDAGTSINGGTAGDPVNLLNVTGTVKLKMGAGNDVVTITASDHGGSADAFDVGGGGKDLTIDLNKGDDVLLLAGVTARHVSITANGGQKIITITGYDPDSAVGGAEDVRTALTGNLTVKGSSSPESVYLSGLDVRGHVTLKLSRGGNSATLTPFLGSDRSFDLEIDGNFVYDSTLAGDSNSVTFADPDDAGSIDIGGSASITLGLKNDAVTVTSDAELHVGGNLFVSGCFGDDSFYLSNVQVDHLLIIYTGVGDDSVTLDDVDYGWAKWIDGKLDIPALPWLHLDINLNKFYKLFR